MKSLETIKSKLKYYRHISESMCIIAGKYQFKNGKECSIIIGSNEEGWEHVSIEMYGRKLPTWDEMCEIKDLCWDDEEEVVQIHPKKSHYINLTEALHLWRPVNGDWSIMNREAEDVDR